ncbi:hypothetical protein QAD02_014770 [Eretmocerus hayati]|uniref:Uncharacterized protein n=1 Tax=Eretmocerus hayati TaxID=131215 RepID=A0ACC2P676_9HYME|nr:hypothetical protein QAD02_014770 [Eretmocerus hayati]
MSAEQLRLELMKWHEQAMKSNEESQKKIAEAERSNKEAEHWKSQYIRMKNKLRRVFEDESTATLVTNGGSPPGQGSLPNTPTSLSPNADDEGGSRKRKREETDRCHKNFDKKSRRDPNWYVRFMSAARYVMRTLRAKVGDATAEVQLPNADASRDDTEDEEDEEENVGDPSAIAVSAKM